MPQKNTVRQRSALIDEMAECLPMIKCLMGGTEAMREAGALYLPKWPSEAEQDYKVRKSVATLFPAFEWTVDVLSGKPFSKPVSWDGVPKDIEALFGDIDLQGTNLHNFLYEVTHSAVSDGFCGILVEYPQASGVKSRADEKKAGLRPYWVKIDLHSLLDVRFERISGKQVISQLRFVELVVEPDPEDEFSQLCIEQVRVIEPTRWRTYREKQVANAREKEWVLHDEGVNTLGVVPFVPVYGKRKGHFKSKPPLAELAYLNVEHWQSKSDQQTILHVARVPLLFLRCFGERDIVIGAHSALISNDEKSDARYIEHSGDAIEAGRLSLQDLEDQMRQIGAELLVVKPGRMTIAQTRADNEPQTCALQRIVQAVEGAADQALSFTAAWMKQPTSGSIDIFSDFGVANQAEATLQFLLDMNQEGKISDETLFEEVQRRGLVNDMLTWKAEKARIKKSPPSPDQTA
ncbi:DUF4055 domain-containing protein [Chromobacterium haemolyticum]|uniref:DUF4055 domain-containing protein n=1 Tax=Chromobacterium haemolyticum TaxID=394935 RepID=UPI004055B83F